MKILVNYANQKYEKAQKWNSWTGKHIGGFDKVISFTPEHICKEYKRAHHTIFSCSRGNGLWLWKPYIIDKVIQGCKDGDIIFYADSGAFFIRNINSLVLSLRKDEKIWVSDCPLIESCFTKEKCFAGMQCDKDVFGSTNQIQATYFMLVCCEESRSFIKEWLSYCEIEELISPEGGMKISQPMGCAFVAHREDQSILSLLCKKKNIIPHRDPSQRGFFMESFYTPLYEFRKPMHLDDHYRSVLFLHKFSSPNIFICIKLLIIMLLKKIKHFRDWKK